MLVGDEIQLYFKVKLYKYLGYLEIQLFYNEIIK